MRTHAWYDAHSFCADTEQRHEATPVVALGNETVAYICIHCLERVRPVRRGSPLWIATEEPTP